ncbi:MAG: ABC transporter substrate-binding protein [Hyphomicrobiaceae bacterium]
MKHRTLGLVTALTAGLAMVTAGSLPADAQTPKRGGVLKWVVPDEPPSFDGHRETTFALIHPVAQYYSVLIRVNPSNPASTTDFVCDLCVGKVPEPTDGGKTYTFKIRKGVKFHDGQPLTAKDVHASFARIIFPPKGVASARRAEFTMVESVTAPDDETIVFKLKYASGAFIPALANPFHFIYSKAKLDKDQHWYEKNILGSGPFVFVSREAGARIVGKRNPDYYHKGQPYLDGIEAIFAKKQSLRVQAIQGDRAAVEFRGLPPKSRDDLVKALGKQVTVQESTWNCVLVVTPNHLRKPFNDARVRRALSLALDRWGGSAYLSKIAIVKTVGGIVFPDHPLAATKAELQKIAGFWPDHKKSQAEARRLLKEAGVPNLKFVLANRAVDQPYTIVGTWLIDQWKQVGMSVTQTTQATGPFWDTLRNKKDFDVALEFNCKSIVNPLLDVAKYTSGAGDNYGSYKDAKVDALWREMNQVADPKKQRELMRAMEKRVLEEEALSFPTLWWHRIIVHRSYMKGWKVSPSHYLNLDMANVWIEK